MSLLRRLLLSCALVVGLVFPAYLKGGVSEVSPQSGQAPVSKSEKAKSAGSATTSAGVATSPATSASTAKAIDEHERKLPGISFQRPNGCWLALNVEGTVFILRFYDAKKKPMKADVPNATTRWKPAQKQGSALNMMNLSTDGFSLVGNYVVQPPLIFKVHLTLINEAGEATESYTVDYRSEP